MAHKSRVILIEDNPAILKISTIHLEEMGCYEATPFLDSKAALKTIQNEQYDLVITDLSMPDIDGMNILEAVQKNCPQVPVIMVTAHATITAAVMAMKAGAYDFITKPIDYEHLGAVMMKALEYRKIKLERDELRAQLNTKFSYDKIVSNNLEMQKIFKTMKQLNHSDANVLITGESGTGKELIAHCIYAHSMRQAGPFIPINCSAFPGELFESEVFGHEKGSFTGAHKRKIGLLEEANRGTFFMDEAFELPLPMQVKILRALEERELRRIGGSEIIPFDVRFIAATNRDPDKALKEGQIREDYFYRLNVIHIHLPPLRERKDDIRLLADHFLHSLTLKSKSNLKGFRPEVLQCFEHYPWPGNIREMRNIIERAIVLAQQDYIQLDDLPPKLHLPELTNSALTLKNLSLIEAKQRTIIDLEKQYLIISLQKHRGNVARVSEDSGMTRRNIHRLIKRYELDPDVWRKGQAYAT